MTEPARAHRVEWFSPDRPVEGQTVFVRTDAPCCANCSDPITQQAGSVGLPDGRVACWPCWHPDNPRSVPDSPAAPRTETP